MSSRGSITVSPSNTLVCLDPGTVPPYCGPGCARLGQRVLSLRHERPVRSNSGLGYERVSQMACVGTLARNGVTMTHHSDFPMAPQQPLVWVWAPSTASTSTGR